jgi:AcrR family transcriptional regulator
MSRVVSPPQKKRKGQITRDFIIAEALRIYKMEGVFLTLKDLTFKMNVGTSFITNHFPTKDDLFVALLENYEITLAKVLSAFEWRGEINFQQQVMYLSLAMDVQYEHLPVTLISLVGGQSHKVNKQISGKWQAQQAKLQQKLKLMVSAGLLLDSILEEKNYASFEFAYINLLTTWLVSFTIYQRQRGYSKVKAEYLKGIMHCFFPFLTAKGKRQFNALKFN